MKYLSPAKINLALDIHGKDESGYHTLTTVLHEIRLCDEIEVKRCEEGIHLDCSDKSLPVDDANLAYKAVCAMRIAMEKRHGPITGHSYEVPEEGECGGLEICITKKIPVGAGLGGGSSNAATLLKACNEIWELNWSNERLAEIGAKIGMDVPFFVYGGTTIGTHYGELMEPLKTGPKLDLVVIHPGEASMTAEMYGMLNYDACGQNFEKTEKMVKALRGDGSFEVDWIGNDCDMLVGRGDWSLGGTIEKMHQDLTEAGAVKTCMCGSGSAVFGVFEGAEVALKAAESLKCAYPFVWTNAS